MPLPTVAPPCSTIAFIALNERMLECAGKTLAGLHDDVRLDLGLMAGAVDTSRRLMAEGVEVVISRGATARSIMDALPDLSVVDMSTSGLDMLTAIHRAKARAERIALVVFARMSDGAQEIGRMLGVEVGVYLWSREEEIGPTIQKALDDGAQIVVGGYIMALIARRMGAPCQPVESSPQTVLSAVREAKAIAHGRAVEKAKGELFHAVLTSTDNGIVAVDNQGLITVCNPVAGRLLRTGEDHALGKPLARLWPDCGLLRVLDTGLGEAGCIERVAGREVMCRFTPISVGGRTEGALATFNDVRKIQRMEATVRRRTLDSGHVAHSRFADILGQSPAIKQALAMGMDYARTRSTVLIHGATGVGKELFAQGIHNASERSHGPFVAVNCAALPGQLLESELFGYVSGAFTGASRKGKPGLFELAHGGSIFLDEIAEMDLPTQGRLLRVLQEKKVMRLGSDQVMPVDVRVVAATNKDLGAQVSRGTFRDDLYYRLNVLRLKLPTLAARKQDIPLLAKRFLDLAASRPGGHVFSPEALRVLANHDWPGNVRELQNVMARVAALLREEVVPGELVRELLGDAPGPRAKPAAPGERERIEEALARCRGRMSEAAKELGVSRATLWRRMRKFAAC